MRAEPLSIICFDFGLKRIGVAVGQTITATANPLTTLTNGRDGPDWDAITELIAQWQPNLIIVGLPLHADGSDNPITQSVKNFGDQLQARYNLPVEFIDERLSSHEAENLMHASKKSKGDLDQYAAKVILDSWFQENTN